MAELFNPYTDLYYSDNSNLDMRLAIYEPDGHTLLGYMTTALTIEIYDRVGKTPTLSLEWSEESPNAHLLDGPRIVVVEIRAAYQGDTDPQGRQVVRWREYRNTRFVIEEDSYSLDDDTRTHTTHGLGVISLFAGSVVWFHPDGGNPGDNPGIFENPSTFDNGRFILSTRPVGRVVRGLVAAAQGRGELPHLTMGFSDTHDSFGQPWPQVSRAYAASTDLRAVISSFLESGLAESWMDGMTLHMARVGSWDEHMMGPDPENGRHPYRPYIRHVMQPQSPETVKWGDAVSDVLVIGEGENQGGTGSTRARYVYPPGNDLGNDPERFPFGPRSRVVEAGGVTELDELRNIRDRYLFEHSQPARTWTREWTYRGDISVTQYMPYRNFSTGDWIDVDTRDSSRQRMQVQEMSLKRGTNGEITSFVSVGSIHDDLLTQMTRKVQALSDGAELLGTGRTSPDRDGDIIEGGEGGEFDAHPGQERGLKVTEDAGGLVAYGGTTNDVGDFIKTHTSAEIDKDDGQVSLGGAVNTTDTDLVFKGSNYDELKADPSYVAPGGVRGNANTGDGSRVVMASQTSGIRPSDSSVIVEGDNASMTARHEVNQNPLITRQTDLVVTPNGVEINTYHHGGVVTGTDLTVGTVDVTRRLDLEGVEIVTNETAFGQPPRFRSLWSSGLSIGQDGSGQILGTDAEGHLKALPSRDFISRVEVEQLVDGRIDSIPVPVPEDGVGIVDITIVDERRFRIHLSNNTSYTVTMPLGPEGPPGPGMTEARVRQIISEYLDGDGGGGTGPGEPEPDPDLPTVVIEADAQGSLLAALDERGLDYRTVTEIPFNVEIGPTTTSLYRLFRDMAALRTAPAMNTSGVTNMQQMFQGCTSLTYIPDLDTSGVTSMGSMLRDTESLQDGYVRLIGMHPNLTASSRLSMIRGSALTREPFFDTEGNPIP